MEKSTDQLIFCLKHDILSKECQNSVIESLVKNNEPVDSQDFIKNVLLKLATNPDTSYLSSATPQIWMLSWLASSILGQQWATSGTVSAKQVDSLRKEAEFKHILTGLLSASPDSNVFEELTHLYGLVADAKKSKSPVQALSEDAHCFLRESFISNPSATNVIAQKLLCLWSTSFQGTDNELQGIFKEVLWLCVQNLESERDDPQITLNLTNTLMCLISVIQISEEKENSLLEWLCPRLVHLFDLRILSRRLTCLALVSRESPKWLKALNNFEDEHYERCEDDEDGARFERICSRLVDTSGELQVDELFRRMMKTHKHFIEDFLDLCSKLLITKKNETFSMFLASPLLIHLWPIEILYLWDHFHDKENIFALLNWLMDKFKVAGDPVIENMCTKLQHNIRAIEWLKKNCSGRLVANRELLKLVNGNSILEVMRQITSLTAEDKWPQIRKTLLNNFEDQVTGDKLTSEKWSVATFDGFCILSAAFKAIIAGMDLQTLVVLDLSVSTESHNADTNMQFAYTERISKRLDLIKYLICSLFPLHFRVEILENLFSLFFLRHEDIEQENLSDSADEEDEKDFDIRSPEPEKFNVISADHQSDDLTPRTPHLHNIPLIDFHLPSSLISTPISVPVPVNTNPVQDDDLNLNWSWPQRKTKDTSESHTSSLPMELISSGKTVSAGYTKQSPIVPSMTSARSEGLVMHPKSLQLVSSSDVKSRLARSRNLSTEISGRSRIGSSFDETGFICNEFLIRDALSCLKDCLVDTSAAHYSSLSRQPTQADCRVASPVSPESVQARLKRLSQCVSEAAWRLQLVTDFNFTHHVGKFSTSEQSLAGKRPSTPWLYCNEESESESDTDGENNAVEATELSIPRTSSQRTPKRNKSEADKSSESGSQSNATGGGSASGSSNRHARRSKCKLKRPAKKLVSTAAINLMLSSPSSLVVRCLTQGDLVKAQQVIQMPGMEDNSLTVEVTFTGAYQVLQKKLEEKCESPKDLTEVRQIGTSSTLQAIRLAAMSGVQSTMYTSMVETFLSATSLPSITGAATITKDFPQSVTILRGAENYEAMAALDLVLTTGVTKVHSASLLEVASKYSGFLQSSASPKAGTRKLGKQGTQPLGYIGFICSMINLLQEANRDRDVNLNSFPQNISLHRIITSEQFSLNHKVFEEEFRIWSAMQSYRTDYELSLSEEMNQTTSLTAKGIITPTREIHNKLPHLAFRKLVKLCSCASLNGNLLPNQAVQTVREINYLQQLNKHLQLLSSLLIQNIPLNNGFSSPATYFDVLNKSLVRHIGHLVFECEVLPAKLEAITQQMNVDLVYNIVRNCCPQIPVRLQELKEKTNNSFWGRITLNGGQKSWNGPVRHPATVVRTLLADLLEILHQESCINTSSGAVNAENAMPLVTNPSLMRILEETQELEQIDLNILSSDSEILVFYTNLINLMWLHSLFKLELEPNLHEKPTNRSFGLLSRRSLERFVAQTVIGYNVGQLGFVTLLDLHTKLLGKEICSLLLPTSIACASENVCSKNPWYPPVMPCDPRILFAITNGQTESPKIQVLHAESFDLDLSKIMIEFISFSVQLVDNHCLIIPEQLEWLHKHAQKKMSEPENELVDVAEDTLANDEMLKTMLRAGKESSVVDLIRNNCSGTLLADLNRVQDLGSDVAVTVKEPSHEFGITLEYSSSIPSQQKSLNSSISSKTSFNENTWNDCTTQDRVIKYLERHCWLLSVFVAKIHEYISPPSTPTHHSDDRTQCFERAMSSTTACTLKSIYNGNEVLSVLHRLPNSSQLWARLDSLIEKQEWLKSLEILRALPENSIAADRKLQALNDLVACNLASKLPTTDSPTPWSFCQLVGNATQASACVMDNLRFWPANGCKEALLSLLDDTRRLLPKGTTARLQCQLNEIQIFKQISNKCSALTTVSWHEVQLISHNNPSLILNHLIDAREHQLALEWTELRHIANRIQQLVSASFLFLLIDSEPADFISATKFLQSLLTIQSVTICEDLIHQLRSISTLTFVVNYILTSCTSVLTPDDLLRYRHLSIGIRMLAALRSREQTEFLHLIERPHLIVEQFVMNTRLNILEKMLNNVHSLLVQLPIASPVSVHSIDTLLRQYAAKALDFRVIQAQSTSTLGSDEKKPSSLSINSNEEFVMPANVPTKDQWVPNDEVTECMCCNAVTFSMFSRRHHCRRCGRVVCSACSSKRNQVSGYGDVMVRVCDNCYNETQHSDRSSAVSSKEPAVSLQGSLTSSARDLPWQLTQDLAHNSTVREEFGYEYAPSVSLCLAILKLHSEQTAYPRFLLDSCESMLLLLQPVKPDRLNREVDPSLIIRMVRALIIAAKVKYARSGLNTGVAHCDQLLSQADLLSDLVRSDCSHLITGEPLTGHALRRLRDRLVEEELWSLAMDISTKGGLERAGVWAAWGKTSLKSGRWNEARQKFSHCLEKVADKGQRPLRNPPLLLEIIQILETGTYTLDHKVLRQAEKLEMSNNSQQMTKSSPALTILHTLSSLKDIAEGKYPQALSPSNMVIIGPKLDPLFYEECRHYLKCYGSHPGILAFYLRHDDMAAALKHILAQNVEPIIFYEHVYMPCLRRGCITNLHQAIEVLDPTVASWKIYLCCTCSQLERRSLLNVLYQLQLFMKDLIRAAMTCIWFYRSGARSYVDLAANLDHLHNARDHLQIEHTANWGSLGRRRNSSATSAPLLPMKLDARDVDRHISTISQQIEVTKFLRSCQRGTDSEIVPTLFGTNAEKLEVAVLVILCGKNVEEGFGTAFRIIQDYRLEASQVYKLAGKKLASDDRLVDLQQLIRCIQTSGAADTSEMCDQVLLSCVRVCCQKSDPGNIEMLIKMIVDVKNKISAFIDCHQLKSAYLLAIKHDLLDDVQRIYNEAERLGQTGILKICAKKLSQTITKTHNI